MVPGFEKRGRSNPKIMITGASGMLGHPLCEAAKRYWSVYAVYRSNIPKVEGVETIAVDLTDTGPIYNLLLSLRPQVVVHAAAIAQPAFCQKAPDKSDLINAVVPGQLAKYCAQLGIHFVFISTDLVFNGTQAPYSEDNIPSPFCAYSDQKVRAERAVRENHPEATICRIPLLFGLAPYANTNFTVQMLHAIAEKRPINLFVDEYRTPVDNYSAARGILIALKYPGQILHLGGRTRVSRFTLGKMFAKQMDLTSEAICPVSIRNIPSEVKRAPDCSLDSRRAYALGYHPLDLQGAIQRTLIQFQHVKEHNAATPNKGVER